MSLLAPSRMNGASAMLLAHTNRQVPVCAAWIGSICVRTMREYLWKTFLEITNLEDFVSKIFIGSSPTNPLFSVDCIDIEANAPVSKTAAWLRSVLLPYEVPLASRFCSTFKQTWYNEAVLILLYKLVYLINQADLVHSSDSWLHWTTQNKYIEKN
jgi:hypothetical protein